MTAHAKSNINAHQRKIRLTLSINQCVFQVSVVLQGQDDVGGEKEEQLSEWTW